LTMLEGCWAMGAVLSCIVAWVTIPTLGWRWFVIFCGLPAVLLALLVYYKMPETPRYHIINGNQKEAEEVIHDMAMENGKPKLVAITLEPSQVSFDHASVWDLFNSQFRLTTLLLYAMYFVLSFGCGVFVWLPILLQYKKLEVMSMYRSMVIMALSQVPGVIFAAYLIENAGRKAAIGTCFFFGAVSTAIFAMSTNQTVVVAASIFMEFFLAGANGSLSAYTVEVYPTTLRSTAMGSCSSLSRLSSVVNPTIWAALLDIGEETAIFAGAAALTLGLIITMFLPLETSKADLKDHIKKSD
jgi:MFS transporter, putative metabolite:H+ symporter